MSPETRMEAIAEAYALYRAVKLAIDCCFRHIVFDSDFEGREGDSQNLHNMGE